MTDQAQDYPPEPEPSLPDLAPPPELPEFRRYEVRERIGEGSATIVYRAWDREQKRLVALKILRSGSLSSDLTFPVEGNAATGLLHPNVVALYEAGADEGRPYLVFELITGRPFRAILQDESRPQRELLTLLAGAAKGVAAAHEKGIVHRDLKPANILVSTLGEAKVMDFALLQLLDVDAIFMRSGAPPGTPAYLSPEQVDDRTPMLTPATDVFALGAILYEILTGAPPHAGENYEKTRASILTQAPVPPRRKDPKIAPDLEAIALRALEKAPNRRYPTAGAFADDLTHFLAGKPILKVKTAPPMRRTLRKRVLIVVAAFLTLLGIGGGIAFGIHFARSHSASVSPK